MDAPSSSSDRDSLERLAAEFVDRRRRGEDPLPADYARRHPDLAEQILEFFPALEVMEGLKPAAGDPTGSLDDLACAGVAPRLERLGEYRIVREVGRGGMGVVYEAIQESLGRRVALKILPLQGRVDPVQIERFRLESRSAARLHHGHIVPVYGMGEHEGVYYYAMQYIQGHGLDVILEDLRRLRDREPAQVLQVADRNEGTGSMAVARSLLTGRSPSSSPGPAAASITVTQADDSREPRAEAHKANPAVDRGAVLSHSTESSYYRTIARLGVQVAQTLAHAHGQGVLHRDIKPSNLLLDAVGHVWVADFGLAKVEGSDGPTLTGDVVGTLRYMAPERFEGWSDRRSDLYGLGVTLYELLTLRPAFDPATRAKLIERVIHEPPVAPRKLDARIPRDLETIVCKAIAKEPGERYATAEALASDLENFLADRPIVARRSGPAERAWRWCRRNRAAAGLLAASGVAALALVGFAVSLAFHKQLRTAYAEVDRQRAIAERGLTGELRFLYYNRLTFAERELNDNNTYHAEQLLDECPPDRRNWEWHYLKRQCHTEQLSFRAHDGLIWSLAVSPDGRLVATGGQDKTLRLWKAETGREVWTDPGHVDGVWSVAFSPDGRQIASTSGAFDQPDHVRVHEVATGKLVAPSITKAIGQMSSVAYSRDGGWLVIASGETGSDGWVSVCDSRTGRERFAIAVGSDPPYSASLSRDGDSLLAVVGSSNPSDYSSSRNKVVVWDTTTRKERHVLSGFTKPALKACFSPDGRMIAAAGYDPTVRIWDARNGRERHVLPGHRICVNSVTFSPDSRRLASTSDDGSVKIWDAETGSERLALRGYRGSIYPAAFSPDGLRIVTGGSDGDVKTWDAGASAECRTIVAADSAVLASAFSPDGRTLATAGTDRWLKLWEVPSGRQLRSWPGHRDWIWGVAFSPDGKGIASAAGDWQSKDRPGEVKIWDTTGRLVRALPAHRGIARHVAFSSDGRWLASGGGELRTPGQEVIVWDTATWTKRRSIPVPRGGVGALSFGPDGRQIAGSCYDLIQTFDAATGEDRVTMEGHSNSVNGLVFSPDGRWLASSGEDGTVRLWDVSTGQSLRVFLSDKAQCFCVAVSPDGTRIASGGTDQVIKLWDPEMDQPLITLRGHADDITSVAFSPDGRWIASSDKKGQVKLWDGMPKDAPKARAVVTSRANGSR